MDTQQVIDHYRNRSLEARVEKALELANMEEGSLTWADLVPLDQFHVGGIAATRDLAAALAQAAGAEALGELLDVGCGLGGPTRFLAATYDCHVIAIDLTLVFIEVAEKLTQRTGLADRIQFLQANALALPFPDGSFDNAWTQHVAMNIADRSGLYASIHRVLKPGGLLAIYDIIAGDGRELIFPLPWTRTPEISFLVTENHMRELLSVAGFTEISWLDKTDTYAASLNEQTPQPVAPAPLGLHVAMGSEFGTPIANLRQNIAEGRVRLIQTILRKS